ncbi:uncharacterized protein KGF55_005461 [Candida pseudojiufengensis]|uniref:uncharacterized protein n=1 Tax=Candida pseudojiufengensis TaxID=497109 RepID=UPI0022247E42|nr:uncharacterized protein KGF55_005461 [Candida pseudojiufengensis]KAI5959311.1 hypothetical protein KGF55_005461 [Candida pseudojiufengensis]
MNQQILAHWLKEGEHQYKGEATVISQQFRTNLNENNSETIPRVALSELSEAQISNNVISQRIKLNSNSINHQATNVLQIGVTEQEESSAHQSMVEGSRNDASATNLAPTNILIDTNPTALNTNVIRFDSTTKTFKCPIVNCEKGYKTRAHVKRHMFSHGDRTFECSTCSNRYYTGEDLKRHQKSHSRTSNLNAKRSKRSKTNKRLANSNSINHQATSVLQIGVTEQEESSAHQSMVEGSSNDASTTYLAPTNISNDTNPTESNTQIQETNDIRFDSTSMTYKCPIAGCDKRYKSKYHVERHMFSHGDPTFECLICSKKYYTGEALKRHQICHSTSKKYECSYKNCNKRYNRKSDLGRHIRFIHKTTVCTCPFCGKQYSTHGGYSSHLKLHNSFKCDICQKLYATQRKLELHKKSIHL